LVFGRQRAAFDPSGRISAHPGRISTAEFPRWRRSLVAPTAFVWFVSFVVPLSESPAQRLARQIEFIAECDKLKEIFRQTINTQSRRPENDAEHSWAFCLCVIVLAEHANVPHLDVLRVLKMGLIHDLVEIDAGDTFAYDAAAAANQHAREALAADRIFGLLPADQSREFRALWDEFEARATPEAKFAHACDRFQPMLLNARTQGGSWRAHGITHDRAQLRGAPIADGSVVLWESIEQMLRDAVAAGHLAAAPSEQDKK
jgi:putative hydrolases of HD superfamily